MYFGNCDVDALGSTCFNLTKVSPVCLAWMNYFSHLSKYFSEETTQFLTCGQPPVKLRSVKVPSPPACSFFYLRKTTNAQQILAKIPQCGGLLLLVAFLKKNCHSFLFCNPSLTMHHKSIYSAAGTC